VVESTFASSRGWLGAVAAYLVVAIVGLRARCASLDERDRLVRDLPLSVVAISMRPAVGRAQRRLDASVPMIDNALMTKQPGHAGRMSGVHSRAVAIEGGSKVTFVARLLFVFLVACSPSGLSIDAEHPANANAPAGRLAGPPPALHSGVIEPASAPEPARTGHEQHGHEHHGHGGSAPTKPVEQSPDPKAQLLAAEAAAFETAKPVFDKWCAKCHSKDGKQTSAKKREHFDMTSYPFGGHHAMDIHNEIRRSLGLTGKKPTMPADKKGAVQGEELELIKVWADAFEASHKGGAHEGHDAHGGHKH
jgi:hypothetical protein